MSEDVELEVFSLMPMLSKGRRQEIQMTQRLWKCNEFAWAVKNGRSADFNGEKRTLEDLFEWIADQAEECSIFGNGPLLVPVPRSGNSAPSKEPDSDPYPCRSLCQFLEAKKLGRFRELLKRDGEVENKTMDANLSTLIAEQAWPDDSDREIVLIDDVVTRGTTASSCVRALRQAGWKGSIRLFACAQTSAPYPGKLELSSYLKSLVRHHKGYSEATREDIEVWR